MFVRTKQSTTRRKPFDGSRRRNGSRQGFESRTSRPSLAKPAWNIIWRVAARPGLESRRDPARDAALPEARASPAIARVVVLDRDGCRDADRSVADFYITAHFSLSLIALLLCTGCNETERFFSRVSRSRNRASTL